MHYKRLGSLHGPDEPAELHKALARPDVAAAVRKAATEAGITDQDALRPLLDAMLAVQEHASTVAEEHTHRIEALTDACRKMIETSRETVRADADKMAVTLVNSMRSGLEVALSKAALRLPNQIGWLRAVLVGVACTSFLTLGGIAGAYLEENHLTALAAQAQAAFAPGAPGADLWLRLHRQNDIAAALEAAAANGKCGIQEGREACDLSLWLGSPHQPK